MIGRFFFLRRIRQGGKFLPRLPAFTRVKLNYEGRGVVRGVGVRGKASAERRRLVEGLPV